MRAAPVTLLIFLLVTLSGCTAIRERRSKVLVNEANKLMKRDTDVTQQWSDEFVKVFTPANRAKFPDNRHFLVSHARQIIKLLDESSSLNRSAADKYDQAARLSTKDQRRRALASIAAALRKSAEVNDAFKSQMEMVSDETVVEQKTFNERFLSAGQLIQQKRREMDYYTEEGKRLLVLDQG
jgi:hypothetical protein